MRALSAFKAGRRSAPAEQLTIFQMNLLSHLPMLQKNLGKFISRIYVKRHAALYHDEQRFGRSLFGAHLDDFMIQFKDVKSKNFASRGQQKLIVLIAQNCPGEALNASKGAVIFLLDDFMTDFDHAKAQIHY